MSTGSFDPRCFISVPSRSTLGFIRLEPDSVLTWLQPVAAGCGDPGTDNSETGKLFASTERFVTVGAARRNPVRLEVDGGEMAKEDNRETRRG